MLSLFQLSTSLSILENPLHRQYLLRDLDPPGLMIEFSAPPLLSSSNADLILFVL